MIFKDSTKKIKSKSYEKLFTLGIDWEDIALISYEQGRISNYSIHKDFFKEETKYLLNFLSKIGIKCTFFAQAQTAKCHPELLQLIHNNGHLIGSHGLKHIARQRLTDNEFFNDCIESKKIIEDIIQDSVIGYRSPLLSIARSSYFDSLEILKQAGYKFDSSIPSHNLEKIMKNMNLSNDNQLPLKVYPLTSFKNKFVSFNLAGGSTWRVLPSFLTYKVLKSGFTTNNTSFYLHPYEFGARINPYRAINSNSSKFKVLLKSMRWNLNKKAIEKVLSLIAKSNKLSLNPIK